MPNHALGGTPNGRTSSLELSFDASFDTPGDSHVAMPQVPRLHFEPAGPPPKTPGSAPSALWTGSPSHGRLSPTAGGTPVFGQQNSMSARAAPLSAGSGAMVRSRDRSPRDRSPGAATFQVENVRAFTTDPESATAADARAAAPSVVGWSLEPGAPAGDSMSLYGTTIDDKWTPKTSQKGRCCGVEFNLLTAWRGLVVCVVLGTAFILGVVVADRAMGGTHFLGTAEPESEAVPAGAVNAAPPPPTVLVPPPIYEEPEPVTTPPPPPPSPPPSPPPPFPQWPSPPPPPVTPPPPATQPPSPQPPPPAPPPAPVPTPDPATLAPPVEGAARGVLSLGAQIEALTYTFAGEFERGVATSMGVDSRRIEIINIVGGSIIITFDVLPGGTDEPTPTQALVALQEAVDGGTSGGIAGYPIISMQILELPPVAPPVVPAPQPPPLVEPEQPTVEPEPEPEPEDFAVHVCPELYLGPDIGFQSVLDYHNDDNSCRVSMQALSAVCSQFYDECMSFLASPDLSPPPPPSCPDVFLGPDIGFQSVMEYHDSDHTCILDIQELGNVCSQFFEECMSFLAADTADGHFVNPEPEPEPEPFVPECNDNDAASILAIGYDCAEVVVRQECVLVYQFCECACNEDNNPDDGIVATTNCAVVDGFVAPIIGQLAGHDMSLDTYDSPDQLADTAAECALVCHMMDGSPGSVVSRRYCFSFDWNEEESLCLIGTGAVSRHEPGEQDSNGHIDSTATSFCYYERLWDMDISSLHHFSTTHNPMIGRLVQVEGEVTATIAAPTVEVVDEDDLLGGLPEGFFLQQTDLRAMW